MAGQWLTATSQRTIVPPVTASPALTMTRRFIQGFGGLLVIALAASMPWAEFDESGIWVGSVAMPMSVLAGLALTIMVGLSFLSISTWGLVRRLKTSTRLFCLAALAIGAFSIAGIEYGYLRTDGLSAYEYRPAVRMLGYAIGILLLACAVPEEAGFRVALWIKYHRPRRRSVMIAALIVTGAGAVVGKLVLDGMPHIIDGTAYLLEARTLWSGSLTLDTPRYPELFAGELPAFRTTDQGYFAKYPVGWPLVLGLFDTAGVPWLAAPVLAGGLVWVTFFTVRQRGDEGLAAASAVVAGLCPWLWFNAATMMSHLASAVWLLLFLCLLLRGVKQQRAGWFLLSGLALGMAMLTRPADAAFFALPALGYALAKFVQSPKAWLWRMPLLPLGALPLVAAYFWIGRRQRGTPGSSGSNYGGSHLDALLAQMPHSPGHALVWLQESWAGLSGQWLAGALPAGVLIVCGLFFGRKYTRGQGLLLACSASLLLCYMIFVFGGRAWVGPRWYVPLIPGGAVLITAGLLAAAQTARIACAEGVLAAGYLRALAVASLVALGVVLPIRLIELRLDPPHGIDGRVVAAVESAGLEQAVVALPVEGLVPGTTRPHYKRGIAGMWSMRAPFEDSPVIYIRAIEGWEHLAKESWPNRDLYYMNDIEGDYRLIPVIIEQAYVQHTTEPLP
ncbi:MAG: glycosyltransferase family 39 protein [Planctomycetota bacterium]